MAWWSPVPDYQSDRFSYEEEQRKRTGKLNERLNKINKKVNPLLEKRKSLLKESEVDAYTLASTDTVKKLDKKIKILLTRGEILKKSDRYQLPLGERVVGALVSAVLFPIPAVVNHVKDKKECKQKAEEKFTELCLK